MRTMAQQVLEGTWEEITLHAEELKGQRLRVVVLPEDEETNGTAQGQGATFATPEERARAFRQWAESHSKDTPLLSDEAISRESIYGDRG